MPDTCRCPASSLPRVLPSTPILPPSALRRIADFRQSWPGCACRYPAKKMSTGQLDQGTAPRLGRDRRLVRAASARQGLGSWAKRRQRLTVPGGTPHPGPQPVGDSAEPVRLRPANVRVADNTPGARRGCMRPTACGADGIHSGANLPQSVRRPAGSACGDLQQPRRLPQTARFASTSTGSATRSGTWPSPPSTMVTEEHGGGSLTVRMPDGAAPLPQNERMTPPPTRGHPL
jgi:hypothetical protein